MNDRPAPFSPPRLCYVWKLLKALSTEKRGYFDRALQLLDEASEIMPLRSSDRVWRSMLLLRAQRTGEAHRAFGALRDEFKGSDDPDLRYLRHFCTHQMSIMTPGSGQWGYEAKQAKFIDCRRALKRRFPMVTVDEIYEGIQPRR
jgi:hypothetical protein